MKLTHSLGVKIAAVFLFALLTGMAFFGTSLTTVSYTHLRAHET